MIPTYKLKKYFWMLFGVFGVVFFWIGIWDGLGTLPYLEKPIVSLIVGLAILLLSSLFSKEFNPFGSEAENKKTAEIYRIHAHPQKHEFDFKYFDKIKKRYITLSAKQLKSIEKETVLIFKREGKELFIPIHRIKEIYHKGKLL